MLYEATVRIMVVIDDEVARAADESSGNTGQAGLDAIARGLESQFTDWKIDSIAELRDADEFDESAGPEEDRNGTLQSGR